MKTALAPLLAGWLIAKVKLEELREFLHVTSFKPFPPHGFVLALRSGAQLLVSVREVSEEDLRILQTRPDALCPRCQGEGCAECWGRVLKGAS